MKLGKWSILFLASLATFGGYFSFDAPSVLHNQMYRHFNSRFKDSTEFEFQFSLIYSIYSLPNMIIPLIGGILLDKFGIKSTTLLFAALVVFGNFLQTASCYYNLMPLFLIGRFIFGLGAETLQVCANTIIAKWFIGQELAFALGINLSACKLGGVLTDWVSPILEEQYGFNNTYLFISFLCFFCFLSTVYLVVFEPEERGYKPISQSEDQDQDQSSPNSIQNADVESRHIYESKPSYSSLEISKNSNDEAEDAPSDQRNTLNFIYEFLSAFKPHVWILFFLMFFMYGIYVPFNNISNSIILELYFPRTEDLSVMNQYEVAAARLQSIPYFLSVFLTPFLGLSVDWFGHRSLQLTVSAILLGIAHYQIFFRLFGPDLPLSLVGLSYSIYGSVSWACVPVVVAEQWHGTAYGIMASFQNAGQFLIPLILQQLYRLDLNYFSSELFFIYMSVLSILMCLVIWFMDEKYDNAALRMPQESIEADSQDNQFQSNPSLYNYDSGDSVKSSHSPHYDPIAIIPIQKLSENTEPHDHIFPTSDRLELQRQIFQRNRLMRAQSLDYSPSKTTSSGSSIHKPVSRFRSNSLFI